mmetsp:Transcript_4169/g.13213  ORF Transcript_4169/g.13213 Transcript_4169/m.13213 type:complete len:273 (+) Transcript_4169:184-1002(+)
MRRGRGASAGPAGPPDHQARPQGRQDRDQWGARTGKPGHAQGRARQDARQCGQSRHGLAGWHGPVPRRPHRARRCVAYQRMVPPAPAHLHGRVGAAAPPPQPSGHWRGHERRQKLQGDVQSGLQLRVAPADQRREHGVDQPDPRGLLAVHRPHAGHGHCRHPRAAHEPRPPPGDFQPPVRRLHAGQRALRGRVHQGPRGRGGRGEAARQLQVGGRPKHHLCHPRHGNLRQPRARQGAACQPRGLGEPPDPAQARAQRAPSVWGRVDHAHGGA